VPFFLDTVYTNLIIKSNKKFVERDCKWRGRPETQTANVKKWNHKFKTE